MDTKQALLAAALKLIESEGEEHFSTRSVCALANVRAPTLYHHFGSADGLMSAAMAEAFDQFLASKRAAVSSDPVEALREGWDIYVAFAAARPRLYTAMLARVMQGADIPAAREGQAMLLTRIREIEAAGRLALVPEAAAQLAWATANAAAMLYVNPVLQSHGETSLPSPETVSALRDSAMQAICKPSAKD
jgi:Transcriptional regulator